MGDFSSAQEDVGTHEKCRVDDAPKSGLKVGVSAVRNNIDSRPKALHRHRQVRRHKGRARCVRLARRRAQQVLEHVNVGQKRWRPLVFGPITAKSFKCRYGATQALGL